MIFFSYRKAINPSPAIWAAALKTHTIPFPFPTQYLSGGATASTISTGVGGAPCDPQCTGWWTLPATWWRWGRRTGPAAGSSWSRCSPSWQGQAQALSEGGEENSTSHRTSSLFLSHLGPRTPALWPWTGDPNLRKPLSTGTRGPSVLSQPRPGPNNAPSGDRRLQKGRSWPRGTRETHQSTRVSGTAWLTLDVQKHLVTSLFLSLTLSLSPSLRKQCFVLAPSGQWFCSYNQWKRHCSCHSDQSFCKEINKIWQTFLFCWNWKQQNQNFYYESSQTSTKEE